MQLKKSDYEKILCAIENGESDEKIATRHGISNFTVRIIRAGKWNAKNMEEAEESIGGSDRVGESIWRSIPGTHGEYSASFSGKARKNRTKKVLSTNRQKWYGGKDEDALVVSIMVSGKRYIVPVARLVYAAFVGKDFNDPNLEDARTGDNGIEDCSIENIVVYTGE